MYKKKGLWSNPTNYRPVSLTSVLCKIMESLIRDNLVEFTESNNILKSNEASTWIYATPFLSNKPTWSTEGMDGGSWRGTRGRRTVFGLQKGVWQCGFLAHKKLIDKLQTLGIQGNMLRWIEQFLTARTMRVGVRGSFLSVFDCFYAFSKTTWLIFAKLGKEDSTWAMEETIRFWW